MQREAGEVLQDARSALVRWRTPRVTRSLEIAERALRAQGKPAGSAQARILLAEIELRRGRREPAIRHTRAAVRTARRLIELGEEPPVEAARILISAACIKRRQGAYGEARGLVEEVRGLTTGDPEGALDNLLQSALLSPHDPEVRAAALEQAGEAALHLQDDYARALVLLHTTRFFLDCGAPSAALQLSAEAVRIAPEEAMSGAAYVLRGLARWGLGEYPQAVRMLTRAEHIFSLSSHMPCQAVAAALKGRLTATHAQSATARRGSHQAIRRALRLARRSGIHSLSESVRAIADAPEPEPRSRVALARELSQLSRRCESLMLNAACTAEVERLALCPDEFVPQIPRLTLWCGLLDECVPFRRRRS